MEAKIASLLDGAENTFVSCFKDGEVSNLERFIEKEGSVNLKNLADVDSELKLDKHFQEMLLEIEKYCNPNTIQAATGIDVFYILVSGLLRSVLKECLSTPDSKQRKLATELCYKWYREKRRILLETLNVLFSKSSSNAKLEDERFLYQSDEEKLLNNAPITVSVNDYSKLENQEPPLFVNLEKKRQLYIQDTLKQYSRRNLEATLLAREQVKSEKISDIKNIEPKLPQSASNSSDKLKQKWIQSRMTDRLENMEEVERKEMLTRWSFNKARKEEEIHRRLESATYSSQTGDRVHTIVKDKDLKREQEHRMMKQKALQAKLNDVDFLNSSSDEESIDIIDEDFISNKPYSKTTRPDSALSPYSNRELRKQSIFEDVEYYNDSDKKYASTKGLIRPKSSIIYRRPASTSIIGQSPILSAKAAAISGNMPASAPAVRPSTAIVTFNAFEIFSEEKKKKEDEEKARLAAEAAKKAKEEADSKDKKKGGKGAKKDAPKKPAKGKGKKDAKAEESSEQQLPTQPKLLSSTVRTVPPSAFLNEQLDNCEKIQLNLARNGFDVPFSLIARSLVHPEDAPYSECISKLPTPTGSLLNDVVKPKKGKKKGGKKKTKKKK